MASSARQQLREFFRGIGLRQVRLACGTILFAYLVSHFLNHALGNISLHALAWGINWHTAFWQFPPVAFIFYGACLVHSGLGIWALYRRRQFRWKAIEPLQLLLGLSIPFLIIAHIVGVRLGQTLYGHEKLYPQELYLFFVGATQRLWPMLAVLRDKQTGWVPAVATVLPPSRHQLCQAPYLRSLAEPLAEADAACKGERRQRVRQDVGHMIRQEPRTEPGQAGVLTVTGLLPSPLKGPQAPVAHTRHRTTRGPRTARAT